MEESFLLDTEMWIDGIFFPDRAVPSITLIPSATRLQFHRRQDIIITSTIEMYSNQSSTFATHWKVFQCTSTCRKELTLDPFIHTQSNELFIPARTLIHGSFECTCTVTATDDPRSKSSTSMVIEILFSNILVQMIPENAWIIAHTVGIDLLLNPGQYSTYGDGMKLNREVSSWVFVEPRRTCWRFRSGIISIRAASIIPTFKLGKHSNG